MMTKFKAGDKVRIIDVDKIGGASDYFKNGDTTHVINVAHGGYPYLYCNDGDYDDGLFITDRELGYIELITETPTPKYSTEKRKANVGECILITNRHLKERRYTNGDVFEVTEVNNGYVYSGEVGILTQEYEVIVGNNDEPTQTSERITQLESKVATLEAEVQAMKKADKPNNKPIFEANGESAESFADRFSASIKAAFATAPKLTANEQRKAVIERAKAFVENALNRNYPIHSTPKIKRVKDTVWFTNEAAAGISDKAEFIVNTDKRTVVALIKLVDSNRVVHKAIAKCAPGDVFNADIGKAIALGRALGLDVSEFEQAIQPTEVVVGTTIGNIYDSITYKVTIIADGKLYVDGGNTYWLSDTITQGVTFITDDTEAQY